MTENERDFVDVGADNSNRTFIPLYEPNAEQLLTIPLDIEVLISHPDNTLASYEWNEESQTLAVQAAREHGRLEHHLILYVDPSILKEPLSSRVKTPEEIADTVIEAAFEDVEGLYQAIESEVLTPDGVRSIILSAVAAARFGLVENPF